MKNKDYVTGIKLSAGRITNGRKSFDLSLCNKSKIVTSLYQGRFDMDLLPTGNHIIRCYVEECQFQSGNLKIKGETPPKGYCSFTSGRCCYDDSHQKIKDMIPGLKKRIIIKKDGNNE